MTTLVEPKHSAAIEDYLKAIYLLQQEHQQVSTSLLAARLGFALASVTGMLQKLARLGLVEYTPYNVVALTDDGRRGALSVVRLHFLLEIILGEVQWYFWVVCHTVAQIPVIVTV